MKIRKRKKIRLFFPAQIGFCLVWIISLSSFLIILNLIDGRVEIKSYIEVSHKVAPVKKHVKKPAEVKGIYATAYTAGSSRFGELMDFAKKNGINAVVVDIKGPKGEPAFKFSGESLLKYNPSHSLYDTTEVIETLHKNNLYAIARIFVFEDPYLAEHEPSLALRNKNGGFWANYSGVKWLDPTNFAVWKYNADIAREAYGLGFDEINFDYIRFPSDGNLSTIKYTNWDGKITKEEEIEKFFKYISGIMRQAEIPTSADLFGLVCCHNDYDLGIGQVLERALPYFDYVAPMMYPSHYANGFIGYKNPAAFPYEVVKYSMEKANEKRNRLAATTSTPLAELRPWIQDFDMGANYDAAKVEAQIRAIDEEKGEGFLLWNAKNVYTALGKNIQ